ncbi:hypothetical protein BDK92_2218 [Micromonospora pisi]|uniref:Uncharacterized protein n=1 Tax=Micromonospora pisi TaxID=589240 RepID=A0A495JGJ3_9ACTN|nr:hypothetical protein [Micromonospora pisi]RKR87915.1 hypothetical protein BDK92_2218 [Micromonospora pisi]
MGQTDERQSRSLRDHRTAAATATATDPTPEQLLAALALLDGVRADLDRIERALIESARDRRTSWARIAAALGLTSRQAAEQRWLRLRGGSGRALARAREIRQRQQSVDIGYGTAIRHLRAATDAACRELDADPDWDARHPRAGLARTSIEAASTATPGALYALVIQALADLEAMTSTPGGALPDDVPDPVRAALGHLRRAADTARPEPGRPSTPPAPAPDSSPEDRQPLDTERRRPQD